LSNFLPSHHGQEEDTGRSFPRWYVLVEDFASIRIKSPTEVITKARLSKRGVWVSRLRDAWISDPERLFFQEYFVKVLRQLLPKILFFQIIHGSIHSGLVTNLTLTRTPHYHSILTWHDIKFCSWEPEGNVASCQRLLGSFWKHVGMDDIDHPVGYQVEAEPKWISQ
jgi:hypothetical protein